MLNNKHLVKVVSGILCKTVVYYVGSIEYLLNIHQTLAGSGEINNLFQANNEGRLKEQEPLKREKKASEKSTCLEMPK